MDCHKVGLFHAWRKLAYGYVCRRCGVVWPKGSQGAEIDDNA